MGTYVVDLDEVDRTDVATCGGKGAQLGELARLDRVRVPPGFCVTTDAYRRFVAGVPPFGDVLDALGRVAAHDTDGLRAAAAAVRDALETGLVPDEVITAIADGMVRCGEGLAYAVRSSATAEDLPTASFAGQQDTYLNVVGLDAVVAHVRRCWASLFSDRAVTYRSRQGFDHGTVHMAVVVQQLVPADAAGILFTADPVTGNRKVATVDAGFGLGEALVAGLVDPDVYKVRDGVIIERTIATKRLAIEAQPDGGTSSCELDPARAQAAALTDEQVLSLVALGRRIEAHAGEPQDIEWCLAGDELHVVQARPITTLFPVPVAADGDLHVYVSVGHQQMMTDAMRPLGWSMWQLNAMVPMHEAGGRLFVDVNRALSTTAGRAGLLAMMARHDPLFHDALHTVLARDLLPPPAEAGPVPPLLAAQQPAPIEDDPAIVADLVARSEATVTALRRDLAAVTGPDRFEALRRAFVEHKAMLGDPAVMQAVSAGMDAAFWLNDHLDEWLGERNAADTLALSAPGNVTAEMGLALLDVADAIRPHPEVVAFLEGVTDDGFLDELPALPGGVEARAAIEGYLDRYGARCVGEIDITRPRWREAPSTLVPAILDDVRFFGPGAAKARFDAGTQAAARKAAEVLDRLRALPDGEAKAAETATMIDRLRIFTGYREHPKFTIISRFAVYKEALLEEAAQLVRAGVLDDVEDASFLTFDELEDVVRTQAVDADLIDRRREAFRVHQALTPPRVLTSEGEAVVGTHRRDGLPAGALAGLAVSAGTVEGRARVVVDMADADLEPGDILVTRFTDPSWSPLFVTIAGLVTEVGGLMTHGAVVAREYGLPAVVGVERATTTIPDGRRIRVHGTEGYVELLG